MPITDIRAPQISTIPIVSATNDFTYTFNFDRPNVGLQDGAYGVAQVLWVQFTYTATATVGTRTIALDIQDNLLNQIYSIASINTVAAGQNVVHSFLQGVVISPLTIAGFMRTIPVDGIYVFDRWSIRFQDLASVDPADAFTGFMQVRGY